MMVAMGSGPSIPNNGPPPAGAGRHAILTPAEVLTLAT